MPLAAGSRLGPYEVVSAIAAGGMGEVYLARDTRLDRSVAVKVLPDLVAANEDRRARFEREARTVAKLNHPNILGIHDVGESEGVRFIVTELIDGEPVRGPMAVRKLLDVAVQIADGLAAAHEAGVVHRDIKPDNILIGRDGRVKILDFGLAREAVQPPDGPSVTRTVAQGVTSPGTILGTVAYMSPEQARGGLADARSDQFAFGLVLYELASGRQAFVRDSAAQTLSAIIEIDPDLTPLDALPAPIRWVIERCLAKDPAERYESTTDLYRDLRHLRDRQSELSRSGLQDVVAPRPKRRRLVPALVGALIVVALATAGIWWRSGSVRSVDAYRFVPLAVDQGVQSMPAWSPDGQSVAFSGDVDGYYQVFTRRLDQSTSFQLTSLDGDCVYPVWDTAGTRIFFFFVEGTGSVIASSASKAGEVWVVSAAGGAPELLIEATQAFAVAPDGESLVFLKMGDDGSADSNALWRFDLRTRSVHSLKPLFRWWGDSLQGGQMSFAPDGSMLGVIDQADRATLTLYPNPLTTPNGDPTTIRFAPVGGGAVSVNEFGWMPDSRHVVLGLRDALGGDESIWLGDVESGTITRLTASLLWEASPASSPDGRRIAFDSTPLDWDILEIVLPDGPPRALVASSRYDGWGDWMPDGSGLAFSTQRSGRFEIWAQNFRERVPRPVVTPDAFTGDPTIFLVQGVVSPDGRSIAYVRFTPREQRVYVSAIAGSRPVLVAADVPEGSGDAEREDSPSWSPDGRWILFRRGDRLMKALASGGSSPTSIADDVDSWAEGGAGRWLPGGDSVIYRAVDGLKQRPVEGGPARLVTSEQPLLWDVSPDGRIVYAVVERGRRALELVSIDVAAGAVRTLQSLGRKPLTPNYNGYSDTLRAMRVSPDGTRLMYAYLNPDADIWVLEGAVGPGS